MKILKKDNSGQIWWYCCNKCMKEYRRKKGDTQDTRTSPSNKNNSGPSKIPKENSTNGLVLESPRAKLQSGAKETLQLWRNMKESKKKKPQIRKQNRQITWKISSKDSNKATSKKIKNWKTPNYGRIHRFWFDKFKSNHDKLDMQMRKYLEEASIPEWMTNGENNLIQREAKKRSIPRYHGSIMCLRMMLKIQTLQSKEGISYYHLKAAKYIRKNRKDEEKKKRGSHA